MSNYTILRGCTLSNTSSKEECYNLIEDASISFANLSNADFSSAAAIADSKLNTISTIGKVNLSALTLDGQSPGDILCMNASGVFARLPIGTAGQRLKIVQKEIDYMEYTTDALAQASYVTDSDGLATGGTITTASGDKIHTFTSSGNFVVTSSMNVKALVVGGGAATPGGGTGGGAGKVVYNASFPVTPGTYAITVGAAGASSIFSTITATAGSGGTSGNNYTAGTGAGGSYGSAGGGGGGSTANGGNAYGGPGDFVTGGNAGAGTANAITGTSKTYGCGGAGGLASGGSCIQGTVGSRVYGDGATVADTVGNPALAAQGGVVIIRYTPVANIQSYSESTTKTQGSYALKCVATATNSLNKTLTRTVDPTIDLTGVDELTFSIRATRTGSNIKLSIKDSGGTVTTITPAISSANTWYDIDWDISEVADADKNAISEIKITVVNADYENTFYIDNFFTGTGDIPLEWVTP